MKWKKILTIILASLCVIGLCLVNAFLANPRQLKVREETLSSAKIDHDLEGLQIAYFSDLHYGTFIDDAFVTKMADKISEFTPDVILFGGDLVDHLQEHPISEEQKETLIGILKSLKAPYGKYAVLGEQDLENLAVKEAVEEILLSSDFRIITNTSTRIFADRDSSFNLIGIDSLAAGKPQPETAYEGVNPYYYTIVLTHCPDTFDSLPLEKTDYVLAGHSHGGQAYLPILDLFNRKPGCEKYSRGKIVRGESVLDITNGVGMTDKKVRFAADAEIVLYRLMPDS